MFGDKSTPAIQKLSLGVWLIVAFIGFYLLYIGAAIFLPLIISIFLLILFTSIYNFFHRFTKRKYISIALSILLFVVFFLGIAYIIGTQVGSFTENTDKFTEGFGNMVTVVENFFLQNFNINLQQYTNFDFVQKYLGEIDYGAISSTFFGTLTGVVSSIVTVVILLVFILLERGAFKQKIQYMFDVNGTDKMNQIIRQIYEDINVYFVSKFFIALLNAIIAAIIMSLFGLDFALTFGLIVFIFDFVPVVGGIIALGLPFLYSLVTFGSIPMSFALLIAMNLPQMISGNIIEPKIMGDRLNLSSFFLIIALLFWSMFWGILGAFLATPIMATINIVLSKFATTKPVAILISKNGKV